MTNVKTRGTWGEMQLGAIIDNVLTPDQFARNVKTVPGSDELVEFAIRLPGKSDEAARVAAHRPKVPRGAIPAPAGCAGRGRQGGHPVGRQRV